MTLKLIQGKQINVNLTGSFTGSFTGSLEGTASHATLALVADTINGYGKASIEQINVGQQSDGDYTYIVRTEELEQSKHTTINIYNNLNFI